MRLRNNQGTLADAVALVTKDLGAISGIVGDASAVLSILGVAKKYRALDFVFDRRAKTAECVEDDCCSLTMRASLTQRFRVGFHVRHGRLPVPARQNGSIGALGAGQVDEAGSLVDGRLARTSRQEIVAECGGIRAADPLDPDAGNGT